MASADHLPVSSTSPPTPGGRSRSSTPPLLSRSASHMSFCDVLPMPDNEQGSPVQLSLPRSSSQTSMASSSASWELPSPGEACGVDLLLDSDVCNTPEHTTAEAAAAGGGGGDMCHLDVQEGAAAHPAHPTPAPTPPPTTPAAAHLAQQSTSSNGGSSTAVALAAPLQCLSSSAADGDCLQGPLHGAAAAAAEEEEEEWLVLPDDSAHLALSLSPEGSMSLSEEELVDLPPATASAAAAAAAAGAAADVARVCDQQRVVTVDWTAQHTQHTEVPASAAAEAAGAPDACLPAAAQVSAPGPAAAGQQTGAPVRLFSSPATAEAATAGGLCAAATVSRPDTVYTSSSSSSVQGSKVAADVFACRGDGDRPANMKAAAAAVCPPVTRATQAAAAAAAPTSSRQPPVTRRTPGHHSAPCTAAVVQPVVAAAAPAGATPVGCKAGSSSVGATTAAAAAATSSTAAVARRGQSGVRGRTTPGSSSGTNPATNSTASSSRAAVGHGGMRRARARTISSSTASAAAAATAAVCAARAAAAQKLPSFRLQALVAPAAAAQHYSVLLPLETQHHYSQLQGSNEPRLAGGGLTLLLGSAAGARREGLSYSSSLSSLSSEGAGGDPAAAAGRQLQQQGFLGRFKRLMFDWVIPGVLAVAAVHHLVKGVALAAAADGQLGAAGAAAAAAARGSSTAVLSSSEGLLSPVLLTHYNRPLDWSLPSEVGHLVLLSPLATSPTSLVTVVGGSSGSALGGAGCGAAYRAGGGAGVPVAEVLLDSSDGML